MYLFGPLLVVLAFGAAMGGQTGVALHMNVAIVDQDRSDLSAALAARFEKSEFITVKYQGDQQTAERMLREGLVDVVVGIPPQFGQKVETFQNVRLKLQIDTSVPLVPVIVPVAVGQVMVQFYTQDVPKKNPLFGLAVRGANIVGYETEFIYGERISLLQLTFPLLMPSIVLSFGMMMSALCIVGERIRGTLPRLLRTPISPSDIVIGKAIAYTGIATWQSLSALLGALAFGGLVVAGNPLLTFATMAAMGFVGVTWGIVHSIVSKSDRQALQMNTIVVLAMMTLGGIVIPIDNMPAPVQVVARLLPANYTLHSLRATIIKAQGLEAVGFDIAYLAIFGLALLVLAMLVFHVLRR